MKKLIAIFLCFTITLSCCYGCGKKTKENKSSSDTGKLVETRQGTIPDVGRVLSTAQTKEGQYFVLGVSKTEQSPVMYTSSDEGATWIATTTQALDLALKEIPEGSMIAQGDMFAQGSVVLVCTNQDGKTKTIVSASKKDSNTFTLEGNVYNARFMNGDKNVCVNRGDKVEQYDTSGKLLHTFKQKNVLDYVVSGKSLIILSLDGLSTFDIDSGEKKEEDTEFAKNFKKELEDLKIQVQNTMETSLSVLKAGEKDSVYLLLSSGIYSCRIGMPKVMKLVRSESTQLAVCDTLSGFWMDGEAKIRVLCTTKKDTITYAYTDKKHAPKEVKEERVASVEQDPDHPTGMTYSDGSFSLFGAYLSNYVADKNEELSGEITIYTLKPNDILNDALTLYNTKRPNVKVNVEVGIEADSNTTVEQAVNALNTRMLSGDGPDIIVMNGLDIEKYQDNSLLMDIDAWYEDMKKEYELFANITDAYVQDGSMYAIPIHFAPSVLAGDKDTLAKIHSLKDLADVIEKDQTTWGNALDMYVPSQFLAQCYPSCSTKILDGGTFHKENLEDMATQMKRIWDVLVKQTKANDAQKDWDEFYKSYFIENKKTGYDSDYELSKQNVNFNLRGLQIPEISNRKVGLGMLYPSSSYYYPIWGCREMKNCIYQAIPFGNTKIFDATLVASISSQTKNEELAKDVLKEMLAPDEQSISGSVYHYGFPVNREGLRMRIAEFDGVIASDFAGKTNVQQHCFLSQEEYDTFLNYVKSFDTPANTDEQVLEIIKEKFDDYLNDKISLDEYLKYVEDKLNLYLQE